MDADKLNAVQDLRRYDHAFLSAKGVEDFAKSFGIQILPVKQYEDLTHPKGLVLDGTDVLEDEKGRYALGMDAKDLAMHICKHLGVKYLEMFGRGPQLRTCCDALEKHFGGKDASNS